MYVNLCVHVCVNECISKGLEKIHKNLNDSVGGGVKYDFVGKLKEDFIFSTYVYCLIFSLTMYLYYSCNLNKKRQNSTNTDNLCIEPNLLRSIFPPLVLGESLRTTQDV